MSPPTPTEGEGVGMGAEGGARAAAEGAGVTGIPKRAAISAAFAVADTTFELTASM